jgi:phosphoribosylformylglycinamidine (FGAM) synthase-like enzyme
VGATRLVVANRELGLALSDDEIDYLLDSFIRWRAIPAMWN